MTGRLVRVALALVAGVDVCSSGVTAGSPRGGPLCFVTFAWRASDASTGGDEEVSGRDALQGVSRRSLEAPLTLA